MIIEENKETSSLPIYDVKEVTVEEALYLLNAQQKRSGESLISRAASRMRVLGDPDRLRRVLQGLA